MSAIDSPVRLPPIRRMVSFLSPQPAAWTLRAKMWVFTCVLLCAFGVGDLTIDGRLARHQADLRAREMMLDLACGFARMVAAEPTSIASGIISKAAQVMSLSHAVDDVYVLDREGRIVAETHDAQEPRLGRALRDPPVLRAIIDRKPTVAVDGTTVTAVAPVVQADGDIVGYVVLHGPVLSTGVDQDVFGAIIPAATYLALGGALVIGFSLSLTRPINTLVAAAARIGRGDLSQPIVVDTNDEFTVLANALNRMMERTATSNVAYERAQRDLAVAVDRAETASRAKSEFLSGMSHELRTPLNAIIGFSDLLTAVSSSTLTEAKRREYAHDINQAGRHLFSLVCDILDYAQCDGGGVALADDAVDVSAMVRSSVAEFAPLAEENGVVLTANITPGLPAIRGDGERLRQVVASLVSNAVRFTLAGGFATVSLTRDGGALLLRISDNGIGIAENEMAKALTPFGRLGRDIASPLQGVGLGLPLARKLIELHNGVFRIESYPNIGTVVTARLPLDRTLESRRSVPAVA